MTVGWRLYRVFIMDANYLLVIHVICTHTRESLTLLCLPVDVYIHRRIRYSYS